MQLSKEQIQEFKDILEKKEGHEVTWEEATDGAHRLMNLVELCWDSYKQEKIREFRLKEEPKGFSLDGNGRTCHLCKNSMSSTENWFDKWGLKCKVCQKALDQKKIPGFVFKDDKKWYSEFDLKSDFNLKTQHINKWEKEGLLKSRKVFNDNGSLRVRIFLIKDNKDFLPPKELLKSHLIKTTDKEGKDWYHSEPWYKFVDAFEHLKGYKIMDYMKYSNN